MPAEASRLSELHGHAAFRALRERVEYLEEENRQLREALAPQVHFPKAWRLAPKEANFLSALLACRSVLTAERLMVAVYGVDHEMSTGVVSVRIFSLRRKLKPFGIEIENHWARGYSLTIQSRLIIHLAMEAA